MGPIHVPEGETVEVGAALCDVTEGAVAQGSPIVSGRDGKWSGGPMAIPPGESAAILPLPAARAPAAPVEPPSRRLEQRQRFYSPAVLRLGAEHNVNLEALTGSGIGGRVTRRDAHHLTKRKAESIQVANFGARVEKRLVRRESRPIVVSRE